MGHMTLMLGNVLSNETDPFFAHQFNESAPCREYAKVYIIELWNIFLTILFLTAIGCERQSVPGKRVKACQALPNWKELVSRKHDHNTQDIDQKFYTEDTNQNRERWFWQK